MTLERILSAGVNSMITRHHSPHCYHARVQGRGYVNDGGPEFDRADYLRQLERDARSEVSNAGWAPKYGEPGYDQPARGVVLMDWNKLPGALIDALERAGYSIEWSDEWTTCEGCGNALRTQPDGHDWTPAYTDGDDGLPHCKPCNVAGL